MPQTIEDSYTAYGNISRLFESKEPEIMLAGPAGTGKTRGNLEYLNYWATEYPGCRLLMARKTRRSLTESAMVTLERKVLHLAQGVRWRASEQRFQYPNGSIIAVGGLDKPSKIMSSEWDIIYIPEATELTDNDWESCALRLRNGKLPIQQLIGDCNPGPATHWLKQRAGEQTAMWDTRHEDNPVLFSGGQMTAEGRRYLGRLDALTGVRYARYRLGLWVSAEGMVYEDSWNRSVNLIDESPVKREWTRYLAIDFGYTHPFVCLWCAVDPDGRIYVYRQIYKTRTLVEDHAQTIAIASGWYHLLPKGHPRYNSRPAEWADPLPRDIICDHDAEDRATLERHLGLYTVAAKKTVSDGIQAVASRLRVAGDGKPRIMVVRDTLVERDQYLAEGKQPTCLEDEPESYIWDTRQGQKKGEQPVKENDHACLIAGTLITTDQGDVPIEQIKPEDRVLTRNGFKRVKEAGMTAQRAEVYTVRLSNGASLTGTANHPIYLYGQGYIPLRALRYNDIIEDINSCKERYPLCENQPTNQSRLSTKALLSGVTQLRQIGRVRTTTDQMPSTSTMVSAISIRKYGKTRTDQSQRDATSTIRTGTPLIMRWKIWNVLPQKRTRSTTPITSVKIKQHRGAHTSRRYAHWLLRGISQRQGEHGIANSDTWHGTKQNTETTPASTVEKHTNPGLRKQSKADFVLTPARRHGAGIRELTMKLVSASFAGKSLFATNTCPRNTVLVPAPRVHGSQDLSMKQGIALFAEDRSLQSTVAIRNTAHEPVQAVVVCSISKNEASQPVYNLTVENPDGEGEYFANGVLVHNCDALRYMTAHLDLQPGGVSYVKSIWR